MTPEQAREIDRLEFEADCRRARERALAAVAERREDYRRWLHGLSASKPAVASTFSVHTSLGRPEARLTLAGRTLNLTRWAELTGLSSQTLRYRMRQGWPVERILSARDRRGRKPGVASDFVDVSATGAPSNARDFSQLEISE